MSCSTNGKCSCGNTASPLACVTSTTPIAMLGEYSHQLCEALSKPAAAIARQPKMLANLPMLSMGELTGIITPDTCLMLREWSRMVRRDATIERAYLRIDSPGGISSGVPEASEALHKLAQTKPLVVYAEGYLASAAYMLAAAATEIVASRSTLIGSCGTIRVLVDDSAMHEAMGVRVIPITTGRAKQIGLPGVPITDGDVEAIRRNTEASNDEFKLAVRRRKQITPANFEKIFAAADVYKASQAKQLGLIDRIATIEDELGEVAELYAERQAIVMEANFLHISEREAAEQFMEIAQADAERDGWAYACCDHFERAKRANRSLFERAKSHLQDMVRDHADLELIL